MNPKMEQAIQEMTEKEKEYLRKIWIFNDVDSPVVKPNEFKIRFYFPDSELTSVHVDGHVPRIGERIHFKAFDRPYGVDPDPQYDYHYRQENWIVKDIVWIVEARNSLKDQILGRPNLYHVEIILKNKWTLWSELRLRFWQNYYKIKSNIKSLWKKK